MSGSSKLVENNGLHLLLASTLAMGLLAFAILPVISQDADFGEAIETDYAPYKFGRADAGIAQSFEHKTAPQGTPGRSDVIRFSVGGLVQNYGQTEYKITVAAGDSFHYSWTASDDIYYEFHGHTMVDARTPGDAMLYRDEKGAESHGSVTAALDGWHGWYFINDSFDTPIEIELTLWGDYELTPGVINTRDGAAQ